MHSLEPVILDKIVRCGRFFFSFCNVAVPDCCNPGHDSSMWSTRLLVSGEKMDAEHAPTLCHKTDPFGYSADLARIDIFWTNAVVADSDSTETGSPGQITWSAWNPFSAVTFRQRKDPLPNNKWINKPCTRLTLNEPPPKKQQQKTNKKTKQHQQPKKKCFS